MIKFGDIAINSRYVATVINDKLNNQSFINFHNGNSRAIPHSEMGYDQLVNVIEWEQQRYAFK